MQRLMTVRLGALASLCLLLAGLLPATAGAAESDTQCKVAATSALTTFLNPPRGEDNKFFSEAAAGDATITFVMMNHRRMRWLPRSLFEIRRKGSATDNADDPAALGCSNSFLNNLDYFHPRPNPATLVLTPTGKKYNNLLTYPRPEDTYKDGDVNKTVTDIFLSNRFYPFMSWTNTGYQRPPELASTGSDTAAPSTALDACKLVTADATRQEECRVCVGSKGYWLNPEILASADRGAALLNNPKAAVFAGNWLNFYPPRYVLLRTALKYMIGDDRLSRFRIAVARSQEDGAYVVNKFQPACTASGTPTNSFADDIMSATFTDTANPIAETLFNIGDFQAQEARWASLFPSGTATKNPIGPSSVRKGELCQDCDKHFIALFSSGRSDDGNPACIDTSTNRKHCQKDSTVACNTQGNYLGSESDGDDYLPGASAHIGYDQVGAGTCKGDQADDVAKWLQATDLATGAGFPSTNSIETFVVGVGSPESGELGPLRAVGLAGGGGFFSGSNYEEIENNISRMLTQMITRMTSFSSAAVSTFQVNAGATAIIPRFVPQRSADWRGYLYRWGLFNEFVEGTDKNSDGDMQDVFLTDKNGDIVIENDDGVFIRQADQASTAPRKATPHWESGELLESRSPADRKIYTVIDDKKADGTAGSDGRFDHNDSQIEFSVANVGKLLPYLGVRDAPLCGHLVVQLGLTGTLTPEECATYLIRWVRGEDIFNIAGRGTSAARSGLLGDIFHSSPVVVLNPVDKFLCDLGLSSQCLSTLYAQELPVGPTPLKQEDVILDDGTTKKMNAYEAYRVTQQKRQRVVLVGANDGMVHAFNAGTKLATAPEASATNRFPDTHDLGTGQELWAFIPPDMLPKLQRLLDSKGQHHYFMDGDVMVRDIWHDSIGTEANKKEAVEFRTMAVLAERRGGNHYVGLDVTDTTMPRFRWIFPQPGSEEAKRVGESWMSFSPKPPPIGPVLLKKTGGITRTVGGVTAATEERWAVFLQGGYDPNLSRGLGMYALDVYTGKMLLKREYDASGALRQALKFPIAAPVALVDYGSGNANDGPDGFFDTAVVADTGGQVHVLRFHQPGNISDSSELVDNWFNARAFEQGTATDYSLKRRNPFFFIASNTIDPETGQLRTFIGAGDRYSVRDQNAGECRADNPYACGKYGCTYTSSMSLSVGDSAYSMNRTLAGTNETVSTLTTSNTVGSGACTSFSGTQLDKIQCGTAALPVVVKNLTLSCSVDADGGVGACSTAGNVLDESTHGTASLTGVNKNRYYGVWAYGKSQALPDGGVRLREFNSQGTAETFDAQRYREDELTDVTAGASAAKTAPGWRLEYAAYPERTASGSGILGGCVLWNTVQHNPAITTSCSAYGSNTAKFYQANVLTGAADCADSFRKADGTYDRWVARNVLTPPPEPTAAVSISKSGQIKYSIQSFDPGAKQANTADIQASSDVLQLIYSLDVPRSLHACRHTGAANGLEGSCK